MIFSFKHPKKQHIYAVTTGDYVGEMLAFVEQEGMNYNFISIPKNVNRYVPIDKFNTGIRAGVVEKVEKLPSYVYNTLLKEYQYNRQHPETDK